MRCLLPNFVPQTGSHYCSLLVMAGELTAIAAEGDAADNITQYKVTMRE